MTAIETTSDFLRTLARDYPATSRIVEAVCTVWPEHRRPSEKSLSVRSEDVMATTEILSVALLTLASKSLDTYAAHYRWTCDRLREEELFFHREGRYRLTTFAEAEDEVYSNPDYMEKYMDGLLISQVLWFNHAASCDFFLRETPGRVGRGARYLEIGPGHGLMMYLALRDFQVASAAAWDLSEVSIVQTRAALAKLGYTGCDFSVRDVMDVPDDAEEYDLIVVSEVLEHLEDPRTVVSRLRDLLSNDGTLFVNVPINSPSPDHLYLLESPDDARALLTDVGLTVVAEGFFPMQGRKLEQALRNRISISACLFARHS